MPAKSAAQRKYLNAKFGHDWVQEHQASRPSEAQAEEEEETGLGLKIGKRRPAHQGDCRVRREHMCASCSRPSGGRRRACSLTTTIPPVLRPLYPGFPRLARIRFQRARPAHQGDCRARHEHGKHPAKAWTVSAGDRPWRKWHGESSKESRSCQGRFSSTTVTHNRNRL